MAHMSVNETHVYRCCLKHGYYNLECSNNNGPYGWGRSFITILGQKYCHDFVGFKTIRRIKLFGKHNT